MPGPLFILSGPSGVGKSTVLRDVLSRSPWKMRLSVSATTRRPRSGEVDGVHYHFWTVDQFHGARGEGQFLEWAEVYGNYYGTLEREVGPFCRDGWGVWLDVDVQGWQHVRQRYRDAVSIFLMTSSMEEFERRLRVRGTETEDAVSRRLEAARHELERAPEYDYRVINDDRDTAVAALEALIRPFFETR